MSTCRWQIDVARHIRTIAPQLWDSILDPEDLQASHAFVRTCQESCDAQTPFWFLTIQKGPDLVCCAVFFAMEVSLDLLAPRWTRRVVRCARRWTPSLMKLPVLFCGLPVSFGRSCLRFRPGAPAAELIRIVDATMQQIAHEQKIDLVCLKEFDEHENTQLSCLTQRAYFVAPSLPACTLPLRWKSFDQYVAAMRADYRRQVMQTLQCRDAADWRLHQTNCFQHHIPRMFELYARVMDRADHQLERLTLLFFESFFVHMRAHAHVLLIEHGEILKAFALILKGPKVSTFLLTGFDEIDFGPAQLYPNLVLFVIQDAIESGAEQLEMGQTSYLLKTRLGGVLSSRTIYLRSRSGWRNRLLKTATPMLFPKTVTPPRRVFRESQRTPGPWTPTAQGDHPLVG